MSATITPSDSGAAASAGAGTPADLPSASPNDGSTSTSRSLGRALSSTNGDNSNTGEQATVDGGSGFFARRSLLMQAGIQLIRPEDVQRLSGNDRAILSTVLFIISAVPVGVFIVLFSGDRPRPRLSTRRLLPANLP